MHQTARRAAFRDNRSHLRVIFQPPDIVYQICSGSECGPGNPAFVSVHGYRDIQLLFQSLYNRNYPFNLLLVGNLHMSWACRLPAHINHVRPFFCHLSGMGKRSINPVVLSTVRKGIRRHV